MYYTRRMRPTIHVNDFLFSFGHTKAHYFAICFLIIMVSIGLVCLHMCDQPVDRFECQTIDEQINTFNFKNCAAPVIFRTFLTHSINCIELCAIFSIILNQQKYFLLLSVSRKWYDFGMKK